jgi:hypothetical protein
MLARRRCLGCRDPARAVLAPGVTVHDRVAEGLARGEQVAGSAGDPEVLRGRPAAARERPHVVDLEGAGGPASLAIREDALAPSTGPVPDRSRHLRREWREPARGGLGGVDRFRGFSTRARFLLDSARTRSRACSRTPARFPARFSWRRVFLGLAVALALFALIGGVQASLTR